MIIGVISDTHVPDRTKRLPCQIADAFRSVDLIIHLGDCTNEEILQFLSNLAPVEAVAGNHDAKLSQELTYKKILGLGNYRVGLVHGDKIRGTREQTIANALKSFEFENVDCILFGHSHFALVQEELGVILMNPGSPIRKKESIYASYGLLHLGQKKIKAELVFF